MCVGKLNETGTRNIASLLNVFTLLKLDLAYGESSIQTPLPLNFLILSDGKSMFVSKDAVLPYEATSKEESTSEVKITESDAIEIRNYVYACRGLFKQYKMEESVSHSIQNDYLAIRKRQSPAPADNKTKPDEIEKIVKETDLKRNLELSRALALSYGRPTLERRDWIEAIAMEKKRFKRNGLLYWNWETEGVGK